MADSVFSKKQKNIREHRQRHIQLHRALDELAADYISQTERLPSKATILDLMRWSSKQAEGPDHRYRGRE